jgi:hypothetical protein
MGNVICSIGERFPLRVINGEVLVKNLHIKIRQVVLE